MDDDKLPEKVTLVVWCVDCFFLFGKKISSVVDGFQQVSSNRTLKFGSTSYDLFDSRKNGWIRIMTWRKSTRATLWRNIQNFEVSMYFGFRSFLDKTMMDTEKKSIRDEIFEFRIEDLQWPPSLLEIVLTDFWSHKNFCPFRFLTNNCTSLKRRWTRLKQTTSETKNGFLDTLVQLPLGVSV